VGLITRLSQLKAGHAEDEEKPDGRCRVTIHAGGLKAGREAERRQGREKFCLEAGHIDMDQS
jgi:hypothetical protein